MSVFKWVVILLIIDAIILAVWTATSPSVWKRECLATEGGFCTNSIGYCDSPQDFAFMIVVWGFHAMLLGIASILCYQTRAIPTEYAEGKWISMALVSDLQVLVVGIPV